MTDWMDSFSTSASTEVVPSQATSTPIEPPTQATSNADWMDGYKPKPNPDLSLKAGSDIPSDKAAQVLKLQDQTGLPTHVIASDVEGVQAKQNQQALSPDFVQDNPKTAELVGQDPHWAALLRDDIPTVGYLERQLNYLTNASMRSELELERTYHGLKGVAGLGGPDNSDRVAEIDKQLSDNFAPPAGASPVTQLFGKAAEVAPIYGAPLALGATGGGLAVAGAATAFGAIETANAYLDYKNKTDHEGNPIPDDTARRWAVASGAITAALSMLAPGGGEVAEPGLKMLTRGGLGEMLENPGIRQAIDKLLQSSIPEAMLKTGAFFGGSAWGHIAAGVMSESKDMSPMAILRSIFSPENNKQVLKATGTGAAVGGTMVAGMGAWKIWTDFSKATDALNTQTAWANVGNAMKNTKAFDMAPEQVTKVMDRLAGDGHTYIPLEKWQEWAEKQKVDPRQAWGEANGNTQSYDEALKTGADLQMSSKAYASKIAASDHNDFFSKILRSNPQAMNAEEAESYLGKQAPEETAKREAVFKIHEEVSPTPKEPEPTPSAQPPAVVPTTPEQAEAEQHIQMAKQDLGHKPLDLEGMGMSETQAAGIRDAEQRAHEAATNQMVDAITSRQRNQATKEWMDERSDVQKQVEQEIISQPEYKAINILQGKLPPGEGIEPFKLSQKIVEQEDVSGSIKGYPKDIMTSRGGIDPDEAATRLGFGSGSELLYKLKTTPKFEDVVNQETNRRMMENHPEITSDTNLPEAAIKAVHNNAYGELLRKQLQHFYTNEFAAAKGLTAKIAGRIPTTDELKEDVNRDVGIKTYKQLAPGQYIQGMRYAQDEAGRALKAGELQKMVDSKRAELRNFEMYRAAQKALETIDKRVAKVEKYSKKSYQEMLGKAGRTYREDVNALLSNPAFENYKAMPYSKLMDYLNQIESKVHEAREQGKLYALEKFTLMDDYRTAFIEQMAKDFKLGENELGFPKPRLTSEKPFLPATQASLTRMEFLFDHYDNWKPTGLAKQGFSDPVAIARGHEGDLIQKHLFEIPKVNINDLVEAIPFSERALWYAKLHYVPEIGMSLFKPNMLQVAAYHANAYTWKALLDGYGWSDAQGMAIISRLNDKELDLVDGISKNFEALRPELFSKQKKFTGIEPTAVEASPYEVNGRKMEGGYTPLTFDNELTAGGSVGDMFEKNWFTAKPSDSNLRSRTNPGGKPPSLDFNNNLRVLGKMIHWSSFAEPLADMGKIIGDKAIGAHMVAALGKDNFDLIKPWMQDIAKNNPMQSSPIDRIYSMAKNASMIANLALKTTSEVKHLLNYSMTFKELGPQYAVKGVQMFLGNPMKTRERWEDIKAMSPYMRQWAANWDKDISAAAKRLNIAGEHSIFGAENLVGRAMSVKTALTHDFTRMLFSLYGYAYMSIGGSSWEGSYAKAMDGQVEGIKSGDEKNAIAFADRTVRTTIAAGNTEDIPAIMRDKGLAKLFTWFYGPMNLMANNVQKDWQKFSGSDKAPRDIAKFAGAEFLNIVPVAILGSVLAGESPKAKDKLKKWMEWGSGAIASEVMGMAPLLRDIPYAIKSRGHQFEDPFLNILSSPLWGIFDLVKHAEHSQRYSTSEIKNLGMTAGYFTELPSRQVMDSWAVAHDWLATHHYKPDNVTSGVFHVLTGKEPRRG